MERATRTNILLLGLDDDCHHKINFVVTVE
jgi:hypothetical protein